MFQRIARRHADRPDEPDASETAAEAADGATATAGATPAERAADAAPDSDAPTERIEAVQAPSPDGTSVEQPTVLQHPVSAGDDAAAPPASVPPPRIDLRTRLPLASPPAAPQPAPEQPIAGTAPATPAPVAAQAPPAASGESDAEAAPRRPGFRARGRMRRRLRYLRRLRELQVRDLGGLVFDLRRFERARDDLVVQKIDQIRACDDELHALEQALDERRDLRDVREPGVGGTCPRCFAIYGSADKFCANCGAALGGAVQGPARPAPPPANPAPAAQGDAPQ